MQIIEEAVRLHDVEFELRIGNRKPREAYLAPYRKRLECAVSGNYLRIRIPELDGYAVAVVEF